VLLVECYLCLVICALLFVPCYLFGYVCASLFVLCYLYLVICLVLFVPHYLCFVFVQCYFGEPFMRRIIVSVNTGLFEMIVRVLTTCHTQYT
jgi:hypothetical protein